MLNNLKKVLVIAGPTASGKTSLSIEAALRFNGEIVSSDSMQIYKYMDIGTAKPSMEERRGIKHYLIDEVKPDEEFSVADFQKLAYKYIGEIHNKGKLPIVCGGTGLYINSLVYNLNFSETETDWDYRKELTSIAESKGNQYLHDMLRQVDPKAAANIHPNNLKRVIRALEVHKQTSIPISKHQEMSRINPPEYDFCIFGLKMERDQLYDRINKRVDIMFEAGLLDEVNDLLRKGYDRNSVAMQGIGYKEVIAYLKGEQSLEETKEIIKRNTRRYAKRQITWFKRVENLQWIDISVFKDINDQLDIIKNCIACSGIFL